MDDARKVADILGIAGRPLRPMPSDVDLLRGWGERLDSMLRDEKWAPRHLDFWVFRPDEHAAHGMIRLGIRYPHAIAELRDALRYIEDRFQEFKDANPQVRCRFCSSYDVRDDDGLRFCNDCGERDEIPRISPELAASTSGNYADALLTLSRMIPVAADAITKAEKCTPQATATPPRMYAENMSDDQRSLLRAIVEIPGLHGEGLEREMEDRGLPIGQSTIKQHCAKFVKDKLISSHRRDGYKPLAFGLQVVESIEDA